MIRQHDAAGANADRLGSPSHIANYDRSGGAGNAGHIVMFREPDALVAPRFRVLRQIKRIAQGFGSGSTLGNRRQIENGKGNHIC